jgi:hypothetical protein
MKATFTFDGTVLRLRLEVEDPMERALARLMESYSAADVSVQYESYAGRGSEAIQAISIHLRKPEPTGDERTP